MDTPSTKNVREMLASQIGHEHGLKLLDVAAIRELPAGTTLIKDSASVDALYFVIDGEVAVSIESGGRVLSLGHLGGGSWIGEISLLCGQIPAPSTVSTDSSVRILEIKHHIFTALLNDDPKLLNALSRVLVTGLAERIRASGALIAQRDPNSFVLGSGSKPTEQEKSFIKSVLQKLAGVGMRGAQVACHSAPLRPRFLHGIAESRHMHAA